MAGGTPQMRPTARRRVHWCCGGGRRFIVLVGCGGDSSNTNMGVTYFSLTFVGRMFLIGSCQTNQKSSVCGLDFATTKETIIYLLTR